MNREEEAPIVAVDCVVAYTKYHALIRLNNRIEVAQRTDTVFPSRQGICFQYYPQSGPTVLVQCEDRLLMYDKIDNRFYICTILDEESRTRFLIHFEIAHGKGYRW